MTVFGTKDYEAGYLTVEEVASLLRLSSSTVYRRSMELGAVRVGPRLLRFPASAVRRLVLSASTETRAER
jgi:excisionase family DNA binding protein